MSFQAVIDLLVADMKAKIPTEKLPGYGDAFRYQPDANEDALPAGRGWWPEFGAAEEAPCSRFITEGRFVMAYPPDKSEARLSRVMSADARDFIDVLNALDGAALHTIGGLQPDGFFRAERTFIGAGPGFEIPFRCEHT